MVIFPTHFFRKNEIWEPLNRHPIDSGGHICKVDGPMRFQGCFIAFCLRMEDVWWGGVTGEA